MLDERQNWISPLPQGLDFALTASTQNLLPAFVFGFPNCSRWLCLREKGVVGSPAELVCGQDEAGALHRDVADGGDPRVTGVRRWGAVNLERLGTESQWSQQKIVCNLRCLVPSETRKTGRRGNLSDEPRSAFNAVLNDFAVKG